MLKYQLRLHAIVFIFGFTGILGKLIQLPAELIVLYRTSIATVVLAAYSGFYGGFPVVALQQRIQWLLTGIIVGIHWYFFFLSIQLSNVSVALVCLSSTALFTTLSEAVILKKKIRPYEVVLAILVIAGMCLVLRFEFRFILGISAGILCALLAALFTVINSRFVEESPPLQISVHELFGAAITTAVLIAMTGPEKFGLLPSASDMVYLLLLAIVATCIAFVVSISVMKKLSPFTVSLTINLEPLYGILIAVLIFGKEEVMSAGFYVGFAIILSTVLVNAYMKKKERGRG